jgi:hypothetical protein
MARSTPTEADLGIAPTDEELTSTPATAEPATPADDADITLSDEQPVLTAPDKDSGDGEAAEKPSDADKPEPEAKTVDLRALQEARAESRDLKQRNSLLEQRLNAILTQMQPQPQAQERQQEQPANEIPPEDDVVGRINWLVAQMQRQGEQQTQERAATNEARQLEEFRTRVATVEQQFRSTTPDYDAAVSFVAESRDRELQTLFPFSTAEQRAHTIREEWGNIARTSIQAGLNPAEQVYNLAKARGFAGAAPQPQPNTPKPLDAAALASAQQRHQSLSDAGGGEGVAPLDAKALAAMDDRTFNAWLSQKGNDKKLEAILGA